MPTYRSINIELHSQFDIETIPEYRPRLQEYYASIGNPGKVPPFLDEKTATCSVYIPVLPGSQFWIGYSVSPPVPEDQQFLFKLFINGAHIVNWSTGKEHDWKGKTMFGLFERTYEDGKTRVEKRVLCFTPPNRKTKQWTDVTDAFDEEAYMEIQVHRAHASKRIEKQIQDYNDTAHGKSRRGIDLVNAGRADAKHPKRFYKSALIDPTDQPFASFRYYYRTWDQIRQLALYEQDAAPGDDATELSVIEPCDAEETDAHSEQATESESEREGWPVPAGIPADIPEPASQGRVDGTEEAHRQKIKSNRLSMPPSVKLDPPGASKRPLPVVAQKNSGKSLKRSPEKSCGKSPKRSPKKSPEKSQGKSPGKSDPADTSYQPHPVYRVDEWTVRTPSPVKSVRENICTPPLGKKRGLLNPATLMSVVAASWRRRGTPNSEYSNDIGSGRPSRSVS